MEAIKSRAWTLQAGDVFASGIFEGGKVVSTRDNRDFSYLRTDVHYTRQGEEIIRCFTVDANKFFQVVPVEA